MPNLTESYTSTGAKFFYHQETMRLLKDGVGRPISGHIMPTDVCQHTCAFCSVATRDGNVLSFDAMLEYVDILRRYGLKSVIISGGGNPLLYRSPHGTLGIAELIDELHDRGLDMGMITNGMKLRDYDGRKSYVTLPPYALDKLTWIRVSMSGLDHKEDEVYVPDVDPEKTTLGFSYVYHDVYQEPAEKNHGKVSTREDLITLEDLGERTWRGKDRLPKLTGQIARYVGEYKPKYVRLLPNCLEPNLIKERCVDLQRIADTIDPSVVFVQYKPPAAPKSCFLGYIHPVLNSDGYVYPCDSCVLNAAADHKFASPWRICHWSDVAKLYEEPVHSLINDPQKQCPGCVFTKSNELLTGVVERGEMGHPPVNVEHPNFV